MLQLMHENQMEKTLNRTAWLFLEKMEEINICLLIFLIAKEKQFAADEFHQFYLVAARWRFTV